jgi:hypothetical protein
MLIFGYGAGYVIDSADLKNAEAVTGFKLGIQPDLDLTVCFGGGHPLTKGMEGQFFGSGGEAGFNKGVPGIYVNDPDAAPLALFAKTQRIGAAVKKHDGWTGIYLGVMESAAPQFLRNVAGLAGLHVYSTGGDVMYFNNSLIAIHASSDGLKTIELPVEAEVVSLWDDQDAGRLKTIRRQMKLGENALYRIGN